MQRLLLPPVVWFASVGAMVILQRISGPPIPTGIGCFFPQKPLEDQVT